MAMSRTTPTICQRLCLGYSPCGGNTRDAAHDYIYGYTYDYAHDYAPQLCHKATPTNSFYGGLYTLKDNIIASISFHTLARSSLSNILACKTWEALIIHEKTMMLYTMY